MNSCSATVTNSILTKCSVYGSDSQPSQMYRKKWRYCVWVGFDFNYSNEELFLIKKKEISCLKRVFQSFPFHSRDWRVLRVPKLFLLNMESFWFWEHKVVLVKIFKECVNFFLRILSIFRNNTNPNEKFAIFYLIVGFSRVKKTRNGFS